MDKISIIIPTKNEEKNLKRLFESLEQISDKIEVVIVDALSTDGTEQITKDKPWVTFISAESSAGKARNIGIKNSKYDIIAMLDADTSILDGWYDEVLFSMKHFAVVAGQSVDPEGKSLPRVPIFVDGQEITYPQCNVAYRKSLFDDVGFLREDMNVGEDVELHYRCVKQGYTIFYNPKMKVYHYERITRKGWIKKAFKNGFGRYEIEKFVPKQAQGGKMLSNTIRLGIASLGYLKGKLFGGTVET